MPALVSPTSSRAVTEFDLDALKVLIDCLNTTPQLDSATVAAKRNSHVRETFERMMTDGVTFGTATGGALGFLSEPDAEQQIRDMANDLGRLVDIVSRSFSDYIEFGEIPAPHYAMRIAVVLRKLKRSDLELQFLTGWCRHFPTGNGVTYGHLVARFAKLIRR